MAGGEVTMSKEGAANFDKFADDFHPSLDWSTVCRHVDISFCVALYVLYLIYSWPQIFAGSGFLLLLHTPFDTERDRPSKSSNNASQNLNMLLKVTQNSVSRLFYPALPAFIRLLQTFWLHKAFIITHPPPPPLWGSQATVYVVNRGSSQPMWARFMVLLWFPGVPTILTLRLEVVLLSALHYVRLKALVKFTGLVMVGGFFCVCVAGFKIVCVCMIRCYIYFQNNELTFNLISSLSVLKGLHKCLIQISNKSGSCPK